MQDAYVVKDLEGFEACLTELFSQEQLNDMAKRHGFIKRNRTLTASSFLSSLVFSNESCDKSSLLGLKLDLHNNADIDISREALHKKFTPEAVCFMEEVLSKLLASGKNKGHISKALVSYVDIYPSLCNMAGLDYPSHLDGNSFAPILKNHRSKVNDYIFSRWQNGENILYERFSYTIYYDRKGQQRAHMLYDHKKDPNENNNVVDSPRYERVVDELKNKLLEHIQSR